MQATKVTGENGSLGNSVFQEATSLNDLKLPTKLTTIPAEMVARATVLTTLPSQQMSHKSMVGMAIPRGFPGHWTNNY